MTAQNHTIKKFALELQTRSREQSHALQNRCIKLVKEELAGDMDKLLSTYFPGDGIVRINKIEIDLGDITMEDLEKDFIAKCMAGFTSTIKAIHIQKDSPVKTEMVRIEKEENGIEQFFYFLASGKMPWANYGISFSQWQYSITDAIKSKTDFFKEGFSFFLLKNPRAIERLILQFDDGFIISLIELYRPEVKKEFISLAQILNDKILTADTKMLRKKIFIQVLPGLLSYKNTVDTQQVQELTAWISKQFSEGGYEKIFAGLNEIIETIAEKLFNVFTPGSEKEIAAQKTDKEDEPADNENELNEKVPGKEVDKAMYIQNAGLVLLHPFLQKLFIATGLMQGDSFIDGYNKQKAVHLLQYLVNRQQQLPEYIMPLNKILCGVPGEEHINRFIKLEETEIKEADELLNAVLSHWASLKNTSAEALQETFLQRNGKLSFNETDNYWKLQVERKAVDILLDKIPWGFSYIQLPWMKQALVTEW